MLTIFTVPRPFEGHIDLIQRNALMSWKVLKDSPQIILFGNEIGIKEVCEEYEMDCIQNVKTSPQGTPLVNNVFDKAQEVSQYDIVAFVDADIILMDDFIDTVIRVSKKFKDFLLIGQRYDIDMEERIGFDNPLWKQNIKDKVKNEGILHPTCGEDYHVFRKGAWLGMPSFVIGRSCYDNWITATAIKRGDAVIDGTKTICAIHQEHERRKLEDGRSILEGHEAKNNRTLAGDIVQQGFTSHALWEITIEGVIKCRK